MAERVLDKLWAADNFVDVLALQHDCYPQDAPSIKYNKGHGQFASLDELSVGQKSTALLIIALCDGKMPVIIDQPEDALDIASVWEDIAKKLRHGKYGRQFILTTHNSSLAVGSDSDNFMVLMPLSGDRARVSYRGAIDRQDVRQAVIDHLEGGDEPYKLRQRKYNIN
jgi:ABC-type Mn2+/Zn2+ transport system ATPase subunit